MISIIPAIDLINGKCVRLSQGDYAQKTIYNENPLEVAKMFESYGLKRLHLVDLDGAKAKHIVNHKILEQIATHTKLSIDFGGGLKSDNDLRIAFECGAQMITGGSIAVKSSNVFSAWIEKFGAERIILGADVKEEKIAISGWQEHTDIDLLPFIGKYTTQGITKVICTDISKDGMLQGAAVNLYKKIRTVYPDIYLIASGGIGSIEDIRQLDKANIPAVITGKAFYEGKIALSELKKYV